MSKIVETFPYENIKNFTFERKPVSIPPNLRLIRRIAQIMLILDLTSRKSIASLSKIQLFLWALESSENLDTLKKTIKNQFKENLIFIHYNPYINKACDFALGMGFLEQTNTKRLLITQLGKNYANFIKSDSGLLAKDKTSLKSIGKTISEQKILKILKGVF